MAVPTITAVSPASGPTGGRTFVTITGTNFKTPVVPASGTGPTTAPKPTVRVKFGSKEAKDVKVYGATELTCINPSGDAGAVSVTVENIDDNGNLIPGETVTASSAYTYFIPALTVESELNRLVQTLVLEMRRQIHPNVVITTHTDYDENTADGLNITELSELPGIIVTGPSLEEDRFHSVNTPVQVAGTDPPWKSYQRPRTVSLGFGILAFSDLYGELLNLMQACEMFFHLNKWLYMDRDPADPSKGQVRYLMELTNDFDVNNTINLSNIRHFSGSFVILGFDLEDRAGISDDVLVDKTYKITEDVSVDPEPIEE